MTDIPKGFEQSSRRRLALAGYLDYLVFGVPWTFFVIILSAAVPAIDELPFPIKIGAFFLVEVLLVRFARWSPGNWLLSIRVLIPDSYSAESQETFGGRLFVVRSSTRNAEKWWTLLLGVVCVLDGAKSLVRWTLFAHPMALFGTQVSDDIVPFAMIVTGLIQWALAIGVFRLNGLAVVGGVLFNAFTTISVFTSSALLPVMIEQYTVARREYQGLPVREGEIEMLQSFLPHLFVVAPIVVAAWFLALGLSVKRHSNQANEHVEENV